MDVSATIGSALIEEHRGIKYVNHKTTYCKIKVHRMKLRVRLCLIIVVVIVVDIIVDGGIIII